MFFLSFLSNHRLEKLVLFKFLFCSCFFFLFIYFKDSLMLIAGRWLERQLLGARQVFA